MRRRGPRPLGIALGDLADRLAPATLLAEVQRAWPEAAGAAFAGQCTPDGERAGTITVACSSAVWAQELDLCRSRSSTASTSGSGAPRSRGSGRSLGRPVRDSPRIVTICSTFGTSDPGVPGGACASLMSTVSASPRPLRELSDAGATRV